MVDAAVIGLGYVGMPLAQAASRAGLSVVGFDIDTRVVADLNAGISHVDDLQDRDVAEMLTLGFRATSDPGRLGEADASSSACPRRSADEGGPDLGLCEAAVATVAAAPARPARW